MTGISIPLVNAMLNATSALLLICGFIFIKFKRILCHKMCMLCACIVSSVFLTSYVIYHYHHGATRFLGQGLIRWIYFSILISHTVLAIVIVPLILITLYRAFHHRFDEHRRIARLTLPIWLYVSVTGVVVYWMLYR